jgi:hypothetical protein
MIEHDQIIHIYRDYCDTFQRITEQGENFDRDEAMDLLDRLMNSSGLASQNQIFGMSAALVRTACAYEVDDDAMGEWEETAEYLAESTEMDEDIRRYASVCDYGKNRTDVGQIDPDKYSHDEDWGADDETGQDD